MFQPNQVPERDSRRNLWVGVFSEKISGLGKEGQTEIKQFKNYFFNFFFFFGLKYFTLGASEISRCFKGSNLYFKKSL